MFPVQVARLSFSRENNKEKSSNGDFSGSGTVVVLHTMPCVRLPVILPSNLGSLALVRRSSGIKVHLSCSCSVAPAVSRTI